MSTLEDQLAASSLEQEIGSEIFKSNTSEIQNRTRLLENEIKLFRSELARLKHEETNMNEKLKDNLEKIKNNKQLPYLVSNVVEILDLEPEGVEDGANMDLDSARQGKCAVIKTSTRQTVFLPLIGLVDSDKLTPGDLIGVNKESFLILDKLPAEYLFPFNFISFIPLGMILV